MVPSILIDVAFGPTATKYPGSDHVTLFQLIEGSMEVGCQFSPSSLTALTPVPTATSFAGDHTTLLK